MEIAVDKNILMVAGVAGIILAALFLGWLYSTISPWFANKPAPLPHYELESQIAFYQWSICQRTDAMRMYIQNPVSDHPQVLKLKYDIELYNKMSLQMGESNFSLVNCPKA